MSSQALSCARNHVGVPDRRPCGIQFDDKAVFPGRAASAKCGSGGRRQSTCSVRQSTNIDIARFIDRYIEARLIAGATEEGGEYHFAPPVELHDERIREPPGKLRLHHARSSLETGRTSPSRYVCVTRRVDCDVGRLAATVQVNGAREHKAGFRSFTSGRAEKKHGDPGTEKNWHRMQPATVQPTQVVVCAAKVRNNLWRNASPAVASSAVAGICLLVTTIANTFR